jgi:hypothetical protein
VRKHHGQVELDWQENLFPVFSVYIDENEMLNIDSKGV